MNRVVFLAARCAGGILVLTGLLAASGPAADAGPAPATVPRILTLAQAEDLLLQRNLAIAVTRYQLDASRAARLIAAYKPNPVLTIGAEQLNLSDALGHTIIHTDSNLAAQSTYTARVDKIIERGGKRELRTGQSELLVKAAEAQIQDAIRTQLFQLRQAFTSALVARENLRLAETTDQQYEQTERLTQIKVESGDLANAELYRVRAGRLQFQQTVLQARTSYEQATRDVLNLLGTRVEEVAPAPGAVAGSAGVPPASVPGGGVADDAPQAAPDSLRSAPLEIAGTFSGEPVTQDLAELRRMALESRPDVAAARAAAEAALKGLSLAQAQRVRDVDVASEFQRIGSDNSVGMTVSVPLFIYNDQKAAVAQADAQRRGADAQVRAAEMQAVTDVEKAYQAYRLARRTLDLYSSQNLTQVEKLRSIAAFSYKEGAFSLFELLDAQRTYNQALSAYNQARADYQMSLWQLEQAVGRPLR